MAQKHWLDRVSGGRYDSRVEELAEALESQRPAFDRMFNARTLAAWARRARTEYDAGSYFQNLKDEFAEAVKSGTFCYPEVGGAERERISHMNPVSRFLHQYRHRQYVRSLELSWREQASG